MIFNSMFLFFLIWHWAILLVNYIIQRIFARPLLLSRRYTSIQHIFSTDVLKITLQDKFLPLLEEQLRPFSTSGIWNLGVIWYKLMKVYCFKTCSNAKVECQKKHWKLLLSLGCLYDNENKSTSFLLHEFAKM